MTEDELNILSERLAGSFVDLYVSLCERSPKLIVLTAMTGALASCATAANIGRAKTVAALNSTFDDIESAS